MRFRAFLRHFSQPASRQAGRIPNHSIPTPHPSDNFNADVQTQKAQGRLPQTSGQLRASGGGASILFALFLRLVFAAALGAIGYFTRDYVARNVAFPGTPPRVVLQNRPVWMSDLLAEQIVRAAQPAARIQLSIINSWWISTASSSPAPGFAKFGRFAGSMKTRRAIPSRSIAITCAPVALVEWGDTFWLVDGDGVKLPAQFNSSQLNQVVRGADHRINIRIIQGVLNPPVAAGKKWPGDDLKAGIEMVKLLYGLPYAEEIVKVDVQNYGGRISLRHAQLELGTLYDTTIKWGRPVNGGTDFFVEVPTQKKLQVLKEIYTQYGRVDAGRPWVDIRLDHPTYPSTPDAPVADGK